MPEVACACMESGGGHAGDCALFRSYLAEEEMQDLRADIVVGCWEMVKDDELDNLRSDILEDASRMFNESDGEELIR